MSRCHVVTMSPPHSHITSFSFFPLTLCLSSLWLMGFVLRNHFVVSISSKGLSLLLPMSIVFWTNDWAPSPMNLKQAEFTKKKQESKVKARLANNLTSETTTWCEAKTQLVAHLSMSTSCCIIENIWSSVSLSLLFFVTLIWNYKILDSPWCPLWLQI